MFLSFSSLIAVARTFKTMLHSSGESGHPCLVPDLRGNAFSFSPLRIMFAVIIYGLCYVEVGSFYVHFLKNFNHMWVLTFLKGFLCIYWDCHMVFYLQSVNIIYANDWFAYIENPCTHGINPTWSRCMSFLICYWIIFTRIFLRIFTSMFTTDIGI